MEAGKELPTDMIPAHRRALILDLVRRQGGASIAQLAERIGTSFSTVRRDLDFLTQQGYLERSHGGAILKAPHRSTFEPTYDIGSQVAQGAKAAIGALAATLVEDGQSVIFDSSSTVLACAERVVARNLTLTALTNDIKIALLLADEPAIRVVVSGGTLREGSYTLTGEPGQTFLEGLSADLAFIGIHALARERLSETSLEVAVIKRRMIETATRVVVLADSTKFDHPAFSRVCEIGEIDCIVTDSELRDEDRTMLENNGVEVMIAELPPAP